MSMERYNPLFPLKELQTVNLVIYGDTQDIKTFLRQTKPGAVVHDVKHRMLPSAKPGEVIMIPDAVKNYAFKLQDIAGEMGLGTMLESNRRTEAEDKDKDKKADIPSMIKTVINTKWGGSNEEQMRAVQLMKGLATSDDPKANKFMKALDQATSDMDPKDFE